MQQPAMNPVTVARGAVLRHFGSLRTTLACMGLLALAIMAAQARELSLAPVLIGAIALLAMNLLAALVVHPSFRRQLPLLVFHLALLALVVLVAVGRLTALEGRFELTQGGSFDGALIDAVAGPWHRSDLEHLALRNDGFEIDYAPGRKRGATRNRVRWLAADGSEQAASIGDHHPLVLEGYRIYTSPNKGFAPVLTWKPHQGAPLSGAVHLPSYPMHELRQSREWRLPDGRAVWVMLQFDENLIDPAASGRFRLPDAHLLVLRAGEQRFELAPGGQVEIAGGTLAYDGLRTWMGYRISFDPTLPWLLAAALLAAAALAWHYTERFFFRMPAGAGTPGSHDA